MDTTGSESSSHKGYKMRCLQFRFPNGNFERNTQNEDSLNFLRKKFGYKLGYSLRVQHLLEETNTTTYFKY